MNVIDISGWQKGLDLATLFDKKPTLGGVVIKATGGGQAHNNMPPYEVAYCWKRTA